jgi:hypothetical protein
MHSPRFKIDDVGSRVPKSRCWLEWYSSSPKAWSVMNLRVGWLVGEVCVKPPSHANDGAADATLAMARCHYWVMLTMALSRWLGRGAMSLSSHAGDGAAEVTWPCHDVIAKSCWRWRWCWRGDLVVAWYHCQVVTPYFRKRTKTLEINYLNYIITFVAFMLLHILFWFVIAIIFYFVSGSRLKFKFEF